MHTYYQISIVDISVLKDITYFMGNKIWIFVPEGVVVIWCMFVLACVCVFCPPYTSSHIFYKLKVSVRTRWVWVMYYHINYVVPLRVILNRNTMTINRVGLFLITTLTPLQLSLINCWWCYIMKISDSVLIIQSELNHQICLNSIYMQTYVTYQTNYMNSAFSLITQWLWSNIYILSRKYVCNSL